MAYDPRTSDRADALLEVVLDCIDPGRCDFDSFVWAGEPAWWDCDQIAVWTGGPSPAGFEPNKCGPFEYEHTFNVGVRICCPGAAFDPDTDREKPDFALLSQRARLFRRTVDTLLDCLMCRHARWVGQDCKTRPVWSVSINASDTSGCMTAVLSASLGGWFPECCFPNTDPQTC
jgi:hypothetical protein